MEIHLLVQLGLGLVFGVYAYRFNVFIKCQMWPVRCSPEIHLECI